VALYNIIDTAEKAGHYHFSGLLVGASLRLLNMALSFKERIGDKEIRLF
jgi:hypothetical protein